MLVYKLPANNLMVVCWGSPCKGNQYLLINRVVYSIMKQTAYTDKYQR